METFYCAKKSIEFLFALIFMKIFLLTCQEKQSEKENEKLSIFKYIFFEVQNFFSIQKRTFILTIRNTRKIPEKVFFFEISIIIKL